MPRADEQPSISTLIAEMNDVVEKYRSPLEQARATAEHLGRLIARGANIDEAFTRGCSDHYARYKVHKHPNDRFCIVIMVWEPGQGTALHDHGGVWCVEGVYRGNMKITRYELEGRDGAELRRFRKSEELTVGVGAVGNLVPPSEYHVMENCGTESAISLHIYGHELKKVHRYLPTGDGLHYRIQEVDLCYDNGT